MSDDHDWRESSVMEQYKHMLESGLLSDCSFLVGQEPDDTKEFKAHKTIMSRSSEVFQAMFYGALSENDVVRVTDVTPATFQALLYHVYCDTLEVSDIDMAISVCSAAHKYHLQPLVNKCTDYIGEHLTVGNIWQVLDFANLTDNTKLQQHCINMLQFRTDEVLNADSWCDVDVSYVVTLLQQDTLNVQSELELVSACQHWALYQLNVNNDSDDKIQPDVKSQGVKLKEILAPLMPHIRILSLTPQQLFQAISEDKMLFLKQYQFEIFKCIMEPQNYKIPEGMCEVTSARKIPLGSVVVSQEDQNILEKLKSHLEQVTLKRGNFCYHGVAECSNPDSKICIGKHIVIYGFQFHGLAFNQEDSIVRIFSNNEYIEKFTLKFYNSRICVGIFEFDGKLKYDSKTDFFFPKPFLAREKTELQIKLKFNHTVVRKYPNYYYNKTASKCINDDIAVVNFDFYCLSQILYKVI